MSLLLNMLSRLVITFLPRSKHLLISWLQSPSAVIREPKKESLSLFPLFPHLFARKVWDQMPWSSFSECWVSSQPFQSPLSLSSRGSYFLFVFCHKGGVIWYLSSLIFLPAVLIPACASPSPAFCMMYSAYKLNKQGDNTQSWYTPFPIWNLSVVPRPFLSVASSPAYRFLRRQTRGSGISISLRIFHSCDDPHSQRI